MLKATVSGSFHRHMEPISRAVYELASLSVHVLSPADPRIVAQHGEFLFVASDPVRSVRLVQDRHLECIRAASFLWLVCPDGYVGQSASMEIGFAAGAGVEIFASRAPSDLTLREYVTIVPSIEQAIARISARPLAVRRSKGILIDPRASIARAHCDLELLQSALTSQSAHSDSAAVVRRQVSNLQATLRLPTSIQ